MTLPLLVLACDLTPRHPRDRDVVRLSAGDPAAEPFKKRDRNR